MAKKYKIFINVEKSYKDGIKVFSKKNEKKNIGKTHGNVIFDDEITFEDVVIKGLIREVQRLWCDKQFELEKEHKCIYEADFYYIYHSNIIPKNKEIYNDHVIVIECISNYDDIMEIVGYLRDTLKKPIKMEYSSIDQITFLYDEKKEEVKDA